MWSSKWLIQTEWVEVTCVWAHVIDFYFFLFKLFLANTVTFLSVSFPVIFYPLLSWLFIFPFHLSFHLLYALNLGTTLAGNHRLQQIINPADPLAIQADVHWTHIREKEEEERMVPTSESSTSRGNCFKTRILCAAISTFHPCIPSCCYGGPFKASHFDQK